MVETVNDDRSGRGSGLDDNPPSDIPSGLALSEHQRNFSLRQTVLTVPKPAYYKHLEEGAELGEIDEAVSEEWQGTEEEDSSAAPQRARKFRIRWWAYLLFALTYILIELLRF